MKCRKIIPIILFLILVFVGVSYAWQATGALNALNSDAQHAFNLIIRGEPNALELNAVRIYLKPLVPVSHSVEAIARCQQKALKSA
jgi:hypothetical protein